MTAKPPLEELNRLKDRLGEVFREFENGRFGILAVPIGAAFVWAVWSVLVIPLMLWLICRNMVELFCIVFRKKTDHH
jgi:hypothetical protein